MNNRPKPKQALEDVRRAKRYLQRAAYKGEYTLEGDGPMDQSFAIGAARSCLEFALAALGDKTADPWGERERGRNEV